MSDPSQYRAPTYSFDGATEYNSSLPDPNSPQQYNPYRYDSQRGPGQYTSQPVSYGAETNEDQYQLAARQSQQSQSVAQNEGYQAQQTPYAPVLDQSRNYYPSVAAHQPPSLAWDPQTMSPYADPDFDPNAPVDPDAPEGERGIRHAIIGGTTGYIVGHKSGHGAVGAAAGAVAGEVLSKIRHNIRHHIREDWGEPSKQSSSQQHSSSQSHGSHHNNY